MVKCPKCKKEVDYLIAYSTAKITQRFSLSQGVKGSVEYDDVNREFIDTDYYCVECDELLFKTEQEAINFLRGKDEKRTTNKKT